MRGAAGDTQIGQELSINRTIERMRTCSEGGSPQAESCRRQMTRSNSCLLGSCQAD